MANSHLISGSPPIATVYREYIANDVWTKPAGLKKLLVMCVGAGAGGGSGRKANISNIGGGSGGGGGTIVYRWIPAASLGPTVNITIGTGGAGALAQATMNVNGIMGSVGGDTSFGALVVAKGGPGGYGGQSGNGGDGVPVSILLNTPSQGPWVRHGAVSSSVRISYDLRLSEGGHGLDYRSGMTITGVRVNTGFGAPGGGSGGGNSNAPAEVLGGGGGGLYINGVLTAGAAFNTAGVNDVARNLMLDTGYTSTYGIGTGGGGGKSNFGSGSPNAGWPGGRCAGGGGGAGGGTSMPGGQGGNGLCIVAEFYN